MAMATEEPKNVIEVERCVYEWDIPDFGEKFPTLSKTTPSNYVQTKNGRRFKEIMISSVTFIRGQFVKKTSLWKLWLQRNEKCLRYYLHCQKCYHDDVEEIWTRFDMDIIDWDNRCIHSYKPSYHYSSGNTTRFTPYDKLRLTAGASKGGKGSCWGMKIGVPLTDMAQNLDFFAKGGILKLRLRLYIYRDKPTVDSGNNITPESNNVLASSSSSPLLQAVKNMWTTKQGADVTFSVEGTLIRAHKFVVSAHSPFLNTLLVKKGANGEPIEVPNMWLQPFKQVLEYMYTQEAAIFKSCNDINRILGVLQTCNLLKLTALSKVCLDRLLANMNVDNFHEIVRAVYDSVMEEHSFYKSEVKQFLTKNQKVLIRSENFKKLGKDYPDIFLQLVFQQNET